jgi:hypothetical protein
MGTEGSVDALNYLMVDRKFILIHDLRLPLRLRERFDLALCIEVAEHIHPAYEDVLLDTICSAADILVFSSASPGEGGLHHVNERAPSYWIRKISQRGLRFDSKTTKEIREKIRGLRYLSEVREKLLIFTRRQG